MASVVLTGLRKVFPGGTVAVDDLDLTVADGEFVVLVGPSGCGKSTVLRMVAGLEAATAGTVAIDGRVVNDVPPRDRDVAMVFQNYALYPHFTVSGNMGFSLRVRRTPRPTIREQVDAVARVLDLNELLNRKPVALSGGQRQRVAMGRALVRQPTVMLMDEPLSNLDAKLRVAMRGELTRLHQRYGTTTLYVTHDQIEAMTLGDRIAVLDHGRLQQVGTPEELYGSPRNVFVAGFIGSPAMNLITLRLAPGPNLVCGDRRWPVPDDVMRRHPGLAAHIGAEVVVGLRPDALTLLEPGTTEPVRLDVVAMAVESLGHEKNVLFRSPLATVTPDDTIATEELAEQLWTARLGARAPVTTGQRISLRVDLGAAYFFDPGSGEAIPTVAEPPTVLKPAAPYAPSPAA